MSNYEDDGPGDKQMFPADELERWYLLNGVDRVQRIQGQSLNKLLNVKKYEPDSWYLVTAKGVEKL